MKYENIKAIADRNFKKVKPYILKGMIAGSIRRKKAEPNDIEYVVLVNPDKIEEFVELVEQWKKVRGSPRGRYTQRLLEEGVKLDLFIAQEGNYGNILLQRTGSWKFSMWALGIRTKQVGLKQREGYLWRGDVRLDCEEELEVFDLLGIEWIKPEEREWK